MRSHPTASLTVVAIAAVAGLLATTSYAKTLAYPSPQHASFMVDVPDSWKIEPAQHVGEYMDLASPGGSTLQMRTIEGSHESLADAIKESEAYISETYHEVQIGAVQNTTINGLKASLASGTGKEKDGTPMRIGIAWFALKDGNIGEIWYVAPTGDKAGIDDAAKIVNSYRAP